MMRRRGQGAIGALVIMTLTGGIAASQEAAPPTPTASHKRQVVTPTRHVARAKARRAPTETAPDAAQPASASEPSIGTKTLPEDPVSLGMKWNGSSDTAAQTRVQNYGGTATGSGAEVGLKLHF